MQAVVFTLLLMDFDYEVSKDKERHDQIVILQKDQAFCSKCKFSLVMFNAHGSYSACLVQWSGWTRDVDVFFQWLSAIPFTGGGFNDATIAEGLAEALMMFSSNNGNQTPQNLDGQSHCILVAASNTYLLSTPV